VRPGDSLWSIAEVTLAAAWGHPADPPDLAEYWWRVVEANRRSLPVPSDPDLLFPGDQVVIPAPPARTGST
jgi:nucleoid-associated protein YgaU